MLRSRRFSALRVAIVALAVAFAATACLRTSSSTRSDASDPESPAAQAKTESDSPESTFRRLVEAIRKQDLDEYRSCFNEQALQGEARSTTWTATRIATGPNRTVYSQSPPTHSGGCRGHVTTVLQIHPSQLPHCAMRAAHSVS